MKVESELVKTKKKKISGIVLYNYQRMQTACLISITLKVSSKDMASSATLVLPGAGHFALPDEFIYP